MAAMHCPEVLRRWWSGWADLGSHGEVAGYRDLGHLARLRLDAACLLTAVLRPGFWRALLWCLALGLAAQIVNWTLDRRGWQRDALQCLPVLLAAPWVASARRHYLEARAPVTVRQAATAVTDRVPEPFHSCAVVAAESGRWLINLAARRRAGWSSAGWISSWLSPAWARWRRWRCRGSRS